MNRLFISGLCTLVLMSVSCATGTDLRTMQADLNEARRIAHENRNAIRELSDNLATGEARPSPDAPEVAGTSEVVTNVRQSQAELGLRAEELAREIRTLQGQVDEIEYRMERSLKTLNDQKDLVLIRISALEERVRLVSPTTAAPVIPPPAKPPGYLTPGSVPPAPTGETELEAKTEAPLAVYSRGREYYKSREFVKAREAFASFLEKFPTHEYAGNAQFWVGESFYSEKDFENAILAYEDVLRKYKDSEKVPGAMLKQGFAFASIGDEKTARIILDRVQKKFPGSREATLAAGKLKNLRKAR